MAIGETVNGKIVSETTEPTLHFQWSKDGKLQQMFEIKSFDDWLKCIGVRGEWRDVPTERL